MVLDKKIKSSPDALKLFATAKRIERLESVLNARTSSTRILLEKVQNYHNISAVIRSADAFGIQHLHMIGDHFECSQGITMGSERWVTLHKHFSTAGAISELKQQKYKIVMLQPESFTIAGVTCPSIPIYDLPFSEKLVLAFGNERDGISPELARAADLHAFIPMFGFVDSLNISVAAAITMFCSTIANTKKTRQVQPLTVDEKTVLKKEWLVTGVRNSERILKEIQRRELE